MMRRAAASLLLLLFLAGHACGYGAKGHQTPPPATTRALVRDIRATPDWDATGPPDTWPLQWAADGLRQADEAYTGVVISRKRATADPTKPEWSLTLPPTYLDDATEWVETQLAKGGYRLARLLYAIWP